MNSTLEDLRADLDNRISAAKVSGFWTDVMKDKWLNQAGQRVCDYKRWRELELALETQTRSAKEYYDYPTEAVAFKKDSIYQIDIDGEEYSTDQGGRTRVTWEQFQRAKQIDDDSKLIFTNHNGFYFLFPIPEDGKTMSLYGLKKWRTLTEETDESILPNEFDESVVRIALASCLRKAKKYDQAKAEMVEILDLNVGVLALLWAQQSDEAPHGYGGEAQSSRWS